MKMAKASEADLEMAVEVCGALEGLTGFGAAVPSAIAKVDEDEDAELFDRDNREQCVRVLGHLLDLMNRGNLMRVVWGAAVMLDPTNRCVDPDKDTLEHHPDAEAGLAARQPRPLADWTEAVGPVLWWRFPAGKPWVGQPTDQDFPSECTHWTPLIVPEAPPATPMPAAEAAAA